MKEINVGDTKGLIRKLDALGRVVFPVEFRKQLGMKERGKVEMFLVKDGLYIRKVKE